MFKRESFDQVAAAASEKIKEKNYWLNRLSGEIVKSSFPHDFSKKSTTSRTMDTIDFQFTREITAKLKKLSNGIDQALHVILTTGLVTLLYKYTGRNDIFVGFPIFKQKTKRELINTALVLRTSIEDNMTCKALLLQVKQDISQAMENRNYPIRLLPEQLGLASAAGDDDFPLFDTAVLLENLHNKKDMEQIITNITFSFSREGENITSQVEFNTRLYRKETIKRITAHLQRTLEQLFNHLETPVSHLEILSAEEKEQLLYRFNDTATAYPREKSLQRLLEEQVERTPDRIALKGKTPEHPNPVSLTYSRFNAGANQLASLLRARGLKPGQIAGLLIERGVEMISGIFAILKAGGAYLPLNPGFPENRLVGMLEDCGVSILLTHNDTIKGYAFTRLLNLSTRGTAPHCTGKRPPNPDFNGLPLVDRSLINNEAYNLFIGHGMVKNSITLQATRGCPYDCAFCCRVWPRKLVVRSAENIFAEVQTYYNMGIRRFVFIDDIFNFDIKNSKRFFQLVIEHKLDLQILFPSGLRGDILTPEYIDLMIRAGTISFPLSLETASPRLQKLIKKNLNLERFKENICYITEKYPHVILELNTMHGLPTETEEEAIMTLDFIKSLKYVHFPYVHILRIHSNTYMEKLALDNGISHEAILKSRDLFYHELPDTLPFDKTFTLKYQAEFLDEYFLSKDRLLHVLPWQMKVLTEDELVQKYKSYLPTPIASFADLLAFVDIKPEELGTLEFADEARYFVPHLDEKMRRRFPRNIPAKNALKVLLLDLSQFYSHESEMLYDVVEQPLGIMYVMSYLKEQWGEKINGKIAKSRIDFDSEEELKEMLAAFKPDVIGARTLTMYRDFFHQTIAKIRQWGYQVPVIAGGPYATNDYNTLLHDYNIDLAVLGEGEITFAEVIQQIIQNKGKLPPQQTLEKIPGLAFINKNHTVKEPTREILMLDSLRDLLTREPVSNLKNNNQSSDLAYIAYTSGSTGIPKGVMVAHHNVSRLVKSTNYLTIQPTDIMLQLSNYAFDGSVFDIFAALLNGAALVLLRENDLLDVQRLAALIKNEKITVFFLTTALFNVMVDTNIECFSGIRHVLFGGEKVSPGHVKKALDFLGANRVIHVYGPTETTVFATYYPIYEINEASATVPIGKPLSNTTLYILDKHLAPVPLGVAGEIFIGGDSTALGYLNSEDLTRKKFISSPFVENERLYRTGDLARQLPDGNIEFLERLDNQVKLRGFRIEMGEIETQLLKLDEINEAVVLAKTEDSGDKYLCAYIVTGNALPPDIPAIKEKLSQNLPEFMIPAYFVPLEKIPLTVNGKIHHKALPDPEIIAGKDHVPPRNELETKLAEIWADVLKVNKEVIGINANFFELGGHSLKATVLITRIHKELNVKVTMVELFRNQTIAELSAYITNAGPDKFVSIEPVETKEYYRLSSAQQRMYIMQQLDPGAIGYNISGASYIPRNFPPHRLEYLFQKLIHRHESFRTSIEEVNEKPMQRIHKDADFKIEYHKLPLVEEVDANHREIQKIIKNFVRPFDLGKPPFLRVGLIANAHRENNILLLDMHHIISDLVSHRVLSEELVKIYNGVELPPLKLQYKDYAQWQDSKTQQENIKKQKVFWLKKFNQPAPTLNLKYDFTRPSIKSYEGAHLDFKIERELGKKLHKMVKETDTTLNIVLLTAYYILLAKYSSSEDIVVGSPVSGRRHVHLHNIIGMFTNILSLRNQPRGSKSVGEFLSEVKDNVIEAMENQDYQFDDLVNDLGLQGVVNRNPLFDAAFAMQNRSTGNQSLDHSYQYKNQISKFDLLFNVVEGEETLNITVEYSTRLFKQSTIEALFRHYVEILNQVSVNNDMKLKEVKLSHDFFTISSQPLEDYSEAFGF
jgi:amino acid adenylation domain-containing protein